MTIHVTLNPDESGPIDPNRYDLFTKQELFEAGMAWKRYAQQLKALLQADGYSEEYIAGFCRMYQPKP